ncbi:MAG: hypothetical protein ACR2L9_09680 [Solirubrobacteraceae bacterium]
MPRSLIDPKTLPVDRGSCHVVFPHQYLKVNTIFEVIRSHRMRTAWSDKHVAYEILNGPSGMGIQDLFASEINSAALLPTGQPYPNMGDWTQDNMATMQYDNYKVEAVLNWIDGYNHSRTEKVGVPAILGLNFQTVSTAEKLPVSDGLNGGYLPGTTTPAPLLTRALGFINREVERMVVEIDKHGLARSTAIIISAKHGQSPQDPLALTRLNDGTIIDHLNDAWHKAHPSLGRLTAADPGNTAAGSRDDAFPLWLNYRTPEAFKFVRDFLWNHSARAIRTTCTTRWRPDLRGPSSIPVWPSCSWAKRRLVTSARRSLTRATPTSGVSSSTVSCIRATWRRSPSMAEPALRIAMSRSSYMPPVWSHRVRSQIKSRRFRLRRRSFSSSA